MSESTKPAPTADDPLAFSRWTYGVLIIYSAFLLGIFGLVVMHLADAPRSASASADQRHLRFAICAISDLGSPGSPARSLCPDLLK